MAEDMDDALNGSDGAISKVEDFQQAFYTEMEKVWNETDRIILKVKELITEYGKLAEAAGKDYTPDTIPPETVGGRGDYGYNSGGGYNDILYVSDDTSDNDTYDDNKSSAIGKIVQGKGLMIGGATFVYTSTGQLIPMSDIVKDYGLVNSSDPYGKHHYEIASTARNFDATEAFLYGLENGVGYNIPTDVLIGQTKTYGGGSSPDKASYDIKWSKNSGATITVMALSGDYVKIKRNDNATF
jgi:hypothetical protein